MRLNGTDKKIISPVNLKIFIEEEKYDALKIAVEINGSIIPRSEYASVMISDNDVVEIVSFVGGGWYNGYKA